MRQTITIKLSDTVIKRHAADDQVYQLKDPRHNLYLRFHKSRIKATWYFVKYAKNKAIWHNLGPWPTITAKAMLAQLPDLAAQLAVKHDDKSIGFGEFVTVGQLLDWYLRRSQSLADLSKTRKRAIKSYINKHLKPRLGDFNIESLSKFLIDQHLMQPLQVKYKPSYLDSIFSLLKAVFNQAAKLELLKYNPLSAYNFKDFISATIQPKPTAIRTDQLKSLTKQLSKGEVVHQALAIMMLLHGTRIGETRRTKWQELNLQERYWFIPAAHTKSKVEHRLPLTDQAAGFLTAYKAYQVEHGYDGAFLFPANRQAISENQANDRIQAISNKQWTSHSLRKVASSTLLDLGVQDFVRDIILNHALSKLHKAYIHTYVETQVKEALNIWHNHLLNCGLFFLHPDNITKTEKNSESSTGQSAPSLAAQPDKNTRGVY